MLGAAEKDLKSVLAYPVLFKALMPDQAITVASTGITNTIISDRLYNVEQIALASMGPNSIIDDVQKVPYQTGFNHNSSDTTRLSIEDVTVIEDTAHCNATIVKRTSFTTP